MSDDVYLDFDRRLAIIEERTRPKEKSILDRIKDWSAVLTFIIAVLYTYPLGVWDRFIVTAEQQRNKEIDELRGTIIRLTEIDSEMFRTISSVADVQQQLSYTQATIARKNALLAPKVPLVAKHYSELTGGELELLGYQLNLLGGDGKLVQNVLETASAKMTAAKNNFGAADAYRIQAQLYSTYGSLGPDVLKARSFFKKSIEFALLADPARSLSTAVAVATDWANLEATSGTWSCAEALGKWTIAQYQPINPTYAAQLQSQLTKMAEYRQTAASTANSNLQPPSQGGCPRDILHGI